MSLYDRGMKLVVALAVAVIVGLVGLVGCGSPQSQTATPAVATISIDQARATALAKVPGTVQHEKLKKTKKAQIYSFKIAPTGAEPGKLTKVEVDAVSGAILKVKDVDPNAKKDKKDKDKKDKDDDDDD